MKKIIIKFEALSTHHGCISNKVFSIAENHDVKDLKIKMTDGFGKCKISAKTVTTADARDFIKDVLSILEQEYGMNIQVKGCA